MTIMTTAKSKFYVGTTAAATEVTTFAADTYKSVDEVENLGSWGPEGKEINFSNI